MTTRKQLKKEVHKLQSELRILIEKTDTIYAQAETLDEKYRTTLAKLRLTCDMLGETWAKECPSFKHDSSSSRCIIQSWVDITKSARFCINCPVTISEALIKTLMCKLKPKSEETT